MVYSKKDLLAAIDAVQNGASVKRAALDHNDPRTTLSDKLHGISRIDERKGPCSIFTPEEEAKLVNWVFTCSKPGFPVNDEQLLISAGKYIEELKRENPFTNNVALN
ncbi:unnamed protein product [Bemisia tabaci]|uniref:HTH psq-type domain-containing protein n=1 Tax=Bemisia tabaci TaxID=7038 RepID=A0A9P0ACY3_BEMTA|nr:unnamed protein product [Bemisia tabaci]